MATEGLADGLLGAALDSLATELAVLDTDGTIVRTSSGWEALVDRTVLHEGAPVQGDDYTNAIETNGGEYGAYAKDGLEALLVGDRDRFELEYPCDREIPRRWFSLIAQRITVDTTAYVTLAHTEITERKRSEQASQRAYEIIVDSSTPFSDRVDQIVAHLEQALSQDCACFSRLTDDGHTVESIETVEQAETLPSTMTSNIDRVLSAEETLVFDDFGDDDQYSYLGTPIVAGEEVFGVLWCYSTRREAADIATWETTFLEHVARWLGSELEQRQYTDRLGALDIAFPDRGFVIDENGTFVDCLGTTDVAGVQDIDPDEFVGKTIEEALPEDIVEQSREALQTALETGELQTLEVETEIDGETKWFDSRLAPFPEGYLGRSAVVNVVRDITEQKQRERELAGQRDKLAHLQRLDTLFREIIRALPETETRDEIEQAVCEHLTEAGLYEGVGVGVEDETGEFTIRYETGIETDDADIYRQSETRTLQIGEAETESDCVTVPIATGDTEYGVLVLKSPQDYTLTASEQGLLQDIGEILALEIRRVHSQRSLAADTVLTLELRVPESDIFGTQTTAATDHEIDIQHRIPTEGGHLYYLRVDGDPATIAEQIETLDPVEDCRVVRDACEDMRAGIEVEVGTDQQTPFDVLVDHGASIQETRIADGHMDVHVEIHPEVGARRLVEAVREVAPNTELLSKHVQQRPARQVTDVHDELSAELTEKQEAALRLAYARGYYEWPRDSTVEELAESMSITPSTLHYRLRKAHDAVIDTALVGTTWRRTDE